jgi:isopenicillin-N epimerase
MTSNVEFDWRSAAAEWSLRSDAIYLNHGSFGPPPRAVIAARTAIQRALDEEPMDYFVRQYEPAWFAAREGLAKFVGTSATNLAFVENATAGMNVVAESHPLSDGDEVLINNHEYGAVMRIWERRCQRSGAKLVCAPLPEHFVDVGQVVEAIFRPATMRTRLLVVSHITSPTAIIMPLAEIAAEAKRRGIAVCVDGPHALLQLDVDIDRLGVDYYVASCHKWLCAPFGSGFVMATPEHQGTMRPPQLSWGRVRGEDRRVWSDEFVWSGTRDPSPYLTVPTAIEFFHRFGVAAVRQRMYELAMHARHMLVSELGTSPITRNDHHWYGSMAHVPLPPTRYDGSRTEELRAAAHRLQRMLWDRERIEAPIVAFEGKLYIRVSCHVYNSESQVELLASTLKKALGDF